MKYFLAVVALASFLQALPAPAEETANPVVLAKVEEPAHVTASKLDFRTEIKEKYQYYDVAGMTANDIRRQMNQNGTKWDDGRTYDALTTWEIKYRFNTAYENGKWHINSAKTDVGIIFRYPRWTTASSAPAELNSQWNRYMQQLRLHENGHKDMAIATAREINEAFNTLGGFATSDELEKAANGLAHAKLVRLQQSQKDYDTTTHHGESQGAVFP